MDRSAANTASSLEHMTKDTQLLKAAAVVLNTASSSNSKKKEKETQMHTYILPKTKSKK
jgi:hypothetical protein